VVYNLVLDGGHWVEGEGGVQAVTLGHGMTDSPVVTHAFFGTGKCVEQLEGLPGYGEGRVVVGGVVRGVDGLVAGFLTK
jgi:hypothetical protein